MIAFDGGDISTVPTSSFPLWAIIAIIITVLAIIGAFVLICLKKRNSQLKGALSQYESLDK